MPGPRRRRRGPAIRVEELGFEPNLLAEFDGEVPFNIGPQNDQCQGCGTYCWKLEHRVKDANAIRATYSNCCQQGSVELPLKYFPNDVGAQAPEFYRALLTGTDDGQF